MATTTTTSERWCCQRSAARRLGERLRCNGGPACSAFLAILIGVLLSLLLVGHGATRSPEKQDALLFTCWLMVLVGIGGTLLAGQGNSWGWLVLLGTQPLWVAYAVATSQYGFVVSAIAYGVAQLNGFVRSHRLQKSGRSQFRDS